MKKAHMQMAIVRHVNHSNLISDLISIQVMHSELICLVVNHTAVSFTRLQHWSWRWGFGVGLVSGACWWGLGVLLGGGPWGQGLILGKIGNF